MNMTFNEKLDELEKQAKSGIDEYGPFIVIDSFLALSLISKIRIMKEALQKTSELFVSVDGGRFGAFVSADAVVIARKALSEVEK